MPIDETELRAAIIDAIVDSNARGLDTEQGAHVVVDALRACGAPAPPRWPDDPIRGL